MAGAGIVAVLSPSSRRAWIEIVFRQPRRWRWLVALLAEGVDRNGNSRPGVIANSIKSPSSRRAWIEIEKAAAEKLLAGVALLAEGVDRNTGNSADKTQMRGRPPRGGRG